LDPLISFSCFCNDLDVKLCRFGAFRVSGLRLKCKTVPVLPSPRVEEVGENVVKAAFQEDGPDAAVQKP
jgi:hypothetical protein